MERDRDPREDQGEAEPDRHDGAERGDESERERLDRNLDQLLQELRVALPGVQVLFAFLLTVPFSNGFPTLSDFERDAYFVVLALTAISTVLLISPSAYHRMLFREGRKREIVMFSNRVVIIGLTVLALAMSSAITLIAHVVFGGTAAIVACVLALALFGLAWYLVPLLIERARS
jgi:Kef-type K+ transport system membrane component KefB